MNCLIIIQLTHFEIEPKSKVPTCLNLFLSLTFSQSTSTFTAAEFQPSISGVHYVMLCLVVRSQFTEPDPQFNMNLDSLHSCSFLKSLICPERAECGQVDLSQAEACAQDLH